MSSTLQSGARFRAYPTAEQAAALRRWIGSQRHIYNAKVAEDRLFAAERRMQIRSGADPDSVKTPLDRLYCQFKDPELTPWLSEVPSQVLREGTYRWFNAKQRELKGLAQAPARRNRRNFSSVLLCEDLFEFCGEKLRLGSKKFNLGELRFVAHRAYGRPKMLSISHCGGRWFVSFSYEHQSETILRSQPELAHELSLLEDATLSSLTLGVDRNVEANCAATSAGEFFLPEPVTLARIERKAWGAKPQQRRLARSKKGSKNRAKLACRIARKHAYKADVLRDFAHKTSLAIARSGAKLIAFENLKVQNMVRRPKAKYDESGWPLPNGAAAKAGLNRAILASAWGRIANYTQYKAAQRNVCVAFVAPYQSSQECSRCGHTHPENRERALFLCQRCGHTQHADLNAATNIAARGIAMLRSGALERSKPVKRIAVRRKGEENKAGSGRPEVSVERSSDAALGLAAGNTAQSAVKQKAQAARPDAPTTAPPGV
jgi:putative transposase